MRLALAEYIGSAVVLAALCTVSSLSSGEERASSGASSNSIRIASTSYENAKALNIGPQKLPYPSTKVTARAFGNYFHQGAFDLLVATTTFDPAMPPQRSNKGNVRVLETNAGQHVRSRSLHSS